MTSRRRKARNSTNPFDSSDDESSDEDIFQDCVESLDRLDEVNQTTKRTAPLDFNFAAQQIHEPALNFDQSVFRPSNEFVSPLEAAMLSFADSEENLDAQSGTEVAGGDNFMTPNHNQNDEEEVISPWTKIVQKASGRLDEGSLAQQRLSTFPSDEDIRRSSFRSAASFHSLEENSSTDLENMVTPVTSHRERLTEQKETTMRPRNRRSPNDNKLRSSMKTMKARQVLETLEGSYRDGDFGSDSTGSPWMKSILLEELGTATSWTVLILPYVAFILCVLLDTHSTLMVKTVGPIESAGPCWIGTEASNSNVPLAPSPSRACTYQFNLRTGEGILAGGSKSYLFQTYHYSKLMSTGTAFTSGSIDEVTPLSPFLYGDATFTELSTAAVALVAQGLVLVSSVVMQRSQGNADEWIPVSISKPQHLSMTCEPCNGWSKPSAASLWNCTSPRVVDVLFPMPGTGVLSQDELQVYILYATIAPIYKNDELEVLESVETKEKSYIYTKGPGIAEILEHVSIGEPEDRLDRFVSSSSYTFEHESSSYARTKIGVRILALVTTSSFSCCWFLSLGFKGFFATRKYECFSSTILDCFCSRQSEDMLPLSGRLRSATWWESPWIVFPERRYLVFMLVALILIQNPLLACAYFYPTLYNSTSTHRAADSMNGLGLHLFLLVWLCLMEGLRYHTAAVARRRAKHQRQVLELQSAAKYMADGGHNNCGSEEWLSRYYEQHGDADGSLSAGTLVRLYNDPCGDDWADFLLPKLLLFLAGAMSVLITAFCRFPTAADSSAVLSPRARNRYNRAYIASSFTQQFVLVAWLLLIVRASFATGAKLRKEPFLSTRPAQLSYRILVGITFLGLSAIAVPFLFDMTRLLAKWTNKRESRQVSSQGMDENYEPNGETTVDLLLAMLMKTGEKFPYSGTAASIGPGKILFATICSLVAAFIFLPSSFYFYSDGDENGGVFSALPLTEQLRQRKDKRLVVPLARYTRTWRIFPLPIKQVSVASQLLAETSFHYDASERSVAYFGRYIPVFCLELACWLLEASWQAYYSPTMFSANDFAPGRMDLDRIGLQLEHALYDENTDTQAYIASNISDQVDGEGDSIIVVAFRGTASTKNMQTDLKLRQVPLPQQLMGTGDRPAFRIFRDRVENCDSEGWFWDTPCRTSTNIEVYSPSKKLDEIRSESVGPFESQQSLLTVLSSGAKAAIRLTAVAGPCVHEGFLEAYLHIREKLLAGVIDVLGRQFSKAATRVSMSEVTGDRLPLTLPKVYITGHSLGGTLGQLLALDLASNCEMVLDVPPIPETVAAEELFHLPVDSLPHHEGDEAEQWNHRTLALQPPIAVYTFGQTRLGNHRLAHFYKQRVPHTFRVANELDPFPTLPTPLICGGRYKHAGLEVVLDEGCTGNALVGPTRLETLFRYTKMNRNNVTTHSMERYRDCLESGLRPNELEEYYRGHGTLKMARGSSDPFLKASAQVVADEDLPDWLTQGKRSGML